MKIQIRTILTRIIILALFATLMATTSVAHVFLEAPNGGEVAEVGSKLTVTWRVVIQHNTQNWDLHYSTTGAGGPWKVLMLDLPIGDPTSGSIHNWQWDVPDDVSDQVRVRVTQDNSAIDYTDLSDGDLSIIPAASTDTSFLAIDMTDFTAKVGPSSPMLVGNSPLILVRDHLAGTDYAWIMSLDEVSGQQVGDRLELALSPGADPVDIMWAQFVMTKGMIVLRDDFSMTSAFVTIGGDGTPSAGSLFEVDLGIDPLTQGDPLAFQEVSGLGYADGLPRIAIGTSTGNLVILVIDPVDGALLDEVIKASVDPITDVEVIPQLGYLSIAYVSGGVITGIDPDPAKRGEKGFHIYGLADPRPSPVLDFAVFEPNNIPLTNPEDEVHLVMANGTSELARATLVANESGDRVIIMDMDEPKEAAIWKVAPGSLLMLPADSGGVDYDPAYTPEFGPGGCDISIIDETADYCVYGCCIEVTGNILLDPACESSDETVDVADLTNLIDHLFINFTAICCKDEADLSPVEEPDGVVDVADLTDLIDHLFINFPSLPVCPGGSVAM